MPLIKLMPKKRPLRLLDAGCGNGRLVAHLPPGIEYVGLDNCTELIAIARKNHPDQHFVKGDLLSPTRFLKKFDVVICVAALHHIPTERLQVLALRNLRELLKPQGRLMLTVWDLFNIPDKKRYIDHTTHDAQIPWRRSVKRYYHAFQPAELRSIIKKAGFSRIRRIADNANLIYEAAV